MWLLFFDRSERRATEFFAAQQNPGMVAQTAYTYVPYLLIVGIVLTAVADELVLQHPLGHEGSTDAWTAGLVCGASAVYLLGNALFRRTTGGRWSVTHLLGVVAALAAFLAAARGDAADPELGVQPGAGRGDRRRRGAGPPRASRPERRPATLHRPRTTKARSSSGPGLNRYCSGELAETVGFEPTEGLRLHDLSRVAH